MRERVFVCLSVIPGLVLIPWALLHVDGPAVAQTLWLALAYAAVAVQAGRLPNGLYLNSASPLGLAVVALAVPAQAALVPLLGVAVASRWVGRGWAATAGNLSAFATAYAAGSWAYHALAVPGLSPLESGRNLGALAVALVINESVNVTLVAGRVALGRNLPMVRTIWGSLMGDRSWGHHALNLVALYVVDLTQRGVWTAIPAAVLLLSGVHGAVRFFMQRDRLTRDASFDALTGARNRAEWNRLCAEVGRQPALVAVVDMDGLKALNDRHGHQRGDEALVDLAGKLREAVGTRGTIYRFGGDEFVVYGARDLNQLEHDVIAALVAFGQRWQGHGTSATLGTAYVPAHAGSLEEAFRVADQQMYAVRRANRSGLG